MKLLLLAQKCYVHTFSMILRKGTMISVRISAIFFFILLFFPSISSECENGCSGHGKCTGYDMCVCFRNWQGNDCADRTCQFGLSVVDSPKGDLDSSGYLDNELTAVNSPQYPYGTTEIFPEMLNSDLEIVSQSAHWYTECSNAGICNRKTGECECYEGYEGVACHRMKCPGENGDCNGHGTCQTLRQIASKNVHASYNLWDRDSTRVCLCDHGFYGYDCSMRYCPKGIDPLFYDDVRTIQYPFFFIAIMSTSPTNLITDGFGNPGYFNLEIYDEHGQKYLTRTLTVPVKCDDLISAIEELPNHVVRAGDTICYHNGIENQNAIRSPLINITYAALYKHYFSGTKWYINFEQPATIETGYVSLARNLSSNALLTGDLFLLQFYGRPGEFKQPVVNLYSNGKRPTMMSPDGQIVAATWTNGQQGLDDDFFPIRCNTVQVKLTTIRDKTYLWGAFRLDNLQACMQSADFDDSNNQEENGYSYDVGTIEYPHVIKIVRSVSDRRDGSFMLAIYLETDIYFDYQAGIEDYSLVSPTKSAYRVLHPAYSLDENKDALYDVYVTRGILHRIQNGSRAEFDFGTKHLFMTNISSTYSTDTIPYNDEMGCDFSFGVAGVETNTSTMNCIDHKDYFFVIDPFYTPNNPPFLNLFRVESIRKISYDQFLTFGEANINGTLFDRQDREKVVITTDLHLNGLSTITGGTNFQIYRFIPNYNFVYNVVGECAERGLCNTFEGICECFHGYTGNACEIQDALSL